MLSFTATTAIVHDAVAESGDFVFGPVTVYEGSPTEHGTGAVAGFTYDPGQNCAIRPTAEAAAIVEAELPPPEMDDRS